MDRKAAGSIKMDGRIVDMVVTINGCYCYTENTVRKIRTPEEIDPDNKNDQIPFENTLYRKSGTRNYITARVVIQSKRLMDTVPISIDKETIFAYLMDIETNLLTCNRIFKAIKEQVYKKSKQKIPIYKGVVSKLPTIDELDINVYHFLMSAKQVQQIVASIFNEFHGTNFNGPRIDKVVEEMAKMESDTNVILENMRANLKIYEQIADIRNAQEHPDKNKWLEIDNFKIHDDGKFYVPCIRHYQNGLKLEADIVPWMKSVIDGLLHLVEMQMMYNVSKTMISIPCGLYLVSRRIPENEIDEACPVSMEFFFQKENV